MTEKTPAETESAPSARRGKRGDRVLAIVGFSLAAIAAFFPWYVFFNQESFGIRPIGYASTRDLPDVPGRSVVSVSPLAIPDDKGGKAAPADPADFDPITTATVPNPDAGGMGVPPVLAPASQAYPGKPRYRLLHVANGRALIEDSSGMYIVRVGSVLPDNSRLATLEKRDGRWVIVTSNGEIIDR